MSARKIIAETEHVIVIEQELNSASVVVTFNEFGYQTQGNRFWGDNFLASLNLSSIGFVSRYPNWYPPECMDALIPKVLDRIAGRRVITYGHSQGGYGALKFGKRLNAAVSLGFSPQWSINPDDMRGLDDRFHPKFIPALRNGLKIEAEDLGRRPFVFFDRRDTGDFESAKRLLALPNVSAIHVPFGSHETIKVAVEGKVIEELLQKCQNPEREPSKPDFYELMRRARHTSSTYVRYLRFALLQRGPRSLAFLAELQKRRPDRDSPLYDAVVAFFGGHHATAKELAAAAITDLRPMDLRNAWVIFNWAKYAEGEMAIARKIVTDAKDDMYLLLHAVSTLVSQGEHAAAAELLVKIAPTDTAVSHVLNFVSYAFALDRPDLVELIPVAKFNPIHNIALQFRLAEHYVEKKKHLEAYLKYRNLKELCRDEPMFLSRIEVALTSFDKGEIALERRKRQLQSTLSNVFLSDRLDAVRRIFVIDNGYAFRARMGSVAGHGGLELVASFKAR